MTYGEFLELLEELLLKACTPERRIRRVQVLKNNNVKLDGFSCKIPGHKEQPTVYVNHYYRKEMFPDDVKEIAALILDIFQNSILSDKCEVKDMLDYEKINSYIFPRLISKTKNTELLKDVPYLTWLDLAVVFYIRVPEHIIKNATALIHTHQLKTWRLTLEQLYQTALQNMVMEPILLHPMEQFLEEYGFNDVDSGMYILSNERKEYGAAVIMDPRVQKLCAERFGEDYYVLPSSIHEVILLPVSRGDTRYEMDALVREVNHNCVPKEDYLSDHVYWYSIKDGQLKF